MIPARIAAVAGALVAVAAAGCGVGEGEPGEGEATLTVTRDYGAVPLLEAEIPDPAESETVMRALDREAEIETRYGGGFVDSIEGVSGSAVEDGRSLDWFFYVNGVESSLGAAEVPVRAGDRIWWDHRDWTDAMRVPAVVGSWPEPFAQASTPGDERDRVFVACTSKEPHDPACDVTRETLDQAGAESRVYLGRNAWNAIPEKVPRVLVGPYLKLADDPAARLLAKGPSLSGVFAEPSDRLRGELVALDERARNAARLGPGSGLVAAVREGEGPPTWLVTGADEAGVDAAADLLDAESLDDRYAVATLRGEPLPLPVDPGAAG